MTSGSFLGLLGLLFIGLKLTHVIDWSWWWVTAPIWAPIVFVIAILLLIGTFYLIGLALQTLTK